MLNREVQGQARALGLTLHTKLDSTLQNAYEDQFENRDELYSFALGGLIFMTAVLEAKRGSVTSPTDRATLDARMKEVRDKTEAYLNHLGLRKSSASFPSFRSKTYNALAEEARRYADQVRKELADWQKKWRAVSRSSPWPRSNQPISAADAQQCGRAPVSPCVSARSGNRTPAPVVVRSAAGGGPSTAAPPRASGATPTGAAICLRFRRSSSGTSARSVRLTSGPTPGTLQEILLRAPHGAALNRVVEIAIDVSDRRSSQRM